MQSFNDTAISQMKAVPGLFISNRSVAKSVSFLRSLKITHVLAVIRSADFIDINSVELGSDINSEYSSEFTVKHVDIDDDPHENLLCHLQDICDWIGAALNSTSHSGQEDQGSNRGHVLVYCYQGVSRSVMRTFSLNFSAALSLARESRQIISPNLGFERQLRIWEFCGYDIYESSSSSSLVKSEKRAYKTWKQERNILLNQGEEAINRMRFSSMAALAADFGKRRSELKKAASQETDEMNDATKPKWGEKNQEAWARVEEMEQEWNKKLISGEEI